ncbi:MAG: hypothetical protein DRI61_12500 [Chloroflexi bacterium]|nr:MAG: hypothetical protein DRI61_12500 [Chloroflexota bacterium]
MGKRGGILLSFSLLVLVTVLATIPTVQASINEYDTYIRVGGGQDVNCTDLDLASDNVTIINGVCQINKSIVAVAGSKIWLNDTDITEVRLRSEVEKPEVTITAYDYLEIKNITVTSWNYTKNGPADEYDGRSRIFAQGSSAWIFFYNSTFYNLGYGASSGITTQLGDYAQKVIDCIFTDVVNVLSFSRLYGNINNTSVINNEFTTNNMNAVSVGQNNSRIWNNIAYNGLHFSYNNYNISVYNNTVLGGGWNGLEFNSPYQSNAIDNYVANVTHNGLQIGSYNGIPSFNILFEDDYSKNAGSNAYYISWDGSDSATRPHSLSIKDCIAETPVGRGMSIDSAFNITFWNFTCINPGTEGIDVLSAGSGAYPTASYNICIVDSHLDSNNSAGFRDIELKYGSTGDIFVINTQYDDYRVSSGSYALLYFAYYLDVLVNNESGNPLENADVSVIGGKVINMHNVSFNAGYDARTGGNAIGYYLAPQEISSTTTKTDGHTPLPYEEPDATLVITDFVVDNTTETSPKQSYNYTVIANIGEKLLKNSTETVYPSGAIKHSAFKNWVVVDPDSSWYRANPNTYQNTTTLTINQTFITENEVNMIALPESEPVTIVVSKFNTSLPVGQILVNFTANTSDGNNVTFIIGGLKPDTNYLIKKGGVRWWTKLTNSSGYLTFWNSNWSEVIFTVEESGIVVNAPMNKWTCFRMYPQYNLTFEQIFTNLTNCLALSYYNKTIGMWQSYWSGYDFNKNIVVSEQESLFAYFTAETNLSCNIPSPKAKPLKAEDTTPLYLRGFGNKKIEEIKAALESDGCIVVQVCGWDKNNQEWNCTDDFVVHPSEGFIVQTSNNCVWGEIV